MSRGSSSYRSICCPRPTSAANRQIALAAVDRRDIGGQTDGETLDRFMTLTAYYVGRIKRVLTI